MKPILALALAATVVALAACGTLESLPGIGKGTGAGTTSSPKARPGGIQSHPDRLSGTFNGFCEQREDDGFREKATLKVVSHRVEQLDWSNVIGRKGTCAFRLEDFRQTQTRPHVELLAKDGSGCKLMVYQDIRRVTLAHANCARRCTAGVYDQAWPVMFDPTSGRCASLDK